MNVTFLEFENFCSSPTSTYDLQGETQDEEQKWWGFEEVKEIDQEPGSSEVIRGRNEVTVVKEHKENSAENDDENNGNGSNNMEEGQFGPSR